MTLVATPIYAALLAFIFVRLSLRVIRARRAEKVPLGDGGNAVLLRAMRAQANFGEYTPLALILIASAELQGTPILAVHALGLMLLSGRLIHAYGVSQPDENFRFRVLGMQLTIFTLIGAAIVCLGMTIWPFFSAGV